MIERLASSLGIKGEGPNVELAEEIARSGKKKDIADLVGALAGSDRGLQGDCIKTLYEIGYREPGLIADRVDLFIDLLGSGNNRLVWGAAIALSTIAELAAPACFARLGEIRAAYEIGSVITVDNCVSVFAAMAKDPRCAPKIIPILVAHFERCRIKDLPQHLERVGAKIEIELWPELLVAVRRRLPEASASQRKRIERVIGEP